MRVEIVSASPRAIRSFQAGDWNYSKESIYVLVDESLPPESQLAVAIHEVIEAWLCRNAGMDDKQVTAFDDQYEAEREKGQHGPDDEPGDDPRAPYREEHMAATHVERAVCHALGISWNLHEEAIATIDREPEPPQPE